MENRSEFSPIRSFLWPIHNWEIKKFFPLVILYGLICFNYSLLKATKDALVITANGSGAAVIPFIKIWVILPMALIVTYLLACLFNRFEQEKVFYIMTGTFLSFFVLFALILYPLRDTIHPHRLCTYFEQICPQGFGGFIGMIRYWSFTLFYVMAELWGTTIMSVLFWTFANEIMTVKDAKRIYSILGVGANIGAIVAGQITILVSTQLFDLSFIFGPDSWGQSLGLITIIVIFTGILCIALFRWYHVEVIEGDPKMKKEQVKSHNERKKVKMGLRENFSYIAKSKYLLCIAILVVGFHLAINMVEIIWKDQIRFAYPNPNDFNAYMGKVLKVIGCLSVFIALFISGNMIRRIGWTFSALITPVSLFLTGVFFFGILLLKKHPLLTVCGTFFGLTPLAFAIFFGSVQNVFSRVCKYTLFDATKEIAFIPLNAESKLKGKAAIDGIGSRLGKTGGSMIHSGLLMVFGNVSLSTPFVGGFLFIVVLGWIIATKSLGKAFHILTSHREQGFMEKAPQETGKPSIGKKIYAKSL